MPPVELREELPAFYRLGTLADMSRMAAKLALARKAIKEIRAMEDDLESHKDTVSDTDFKMAMKETSEYATMIAGAMREAVVILKRVKMSVESYQESVHDAAY